MEKAVDYSYDVNITNRNNAVEGYTLKSEYGHFSVPKYSDGCGEEMVRTISFPKEGNWYLLTAGKYFLANSTSLEVIYCIDGKVSGSDFEEQMGFDVPINQTIEEVLHRTFDISYEELPNLVKWLESGFIPPETDVDENPEEDENNPEEDIEVFDLDEEVDEEI